MDKPETKKAQKARLILESIAAKKAFKERAYAETFSTPVAKAVEPLKKDAIDHAEQDTIEFIARLTKMLEEAGNDLNVVAPYPPTNRGREVYRTMAAKRQVFEEITHARTEKTYGYHDTRKGVHLVDIFPEGVKKFIEDAKESAAFQYEAFVFKLVKKIGKTKSAKIEALGVWSFSELTVELESGEIQKWRTRRIFNRSIYGKIFNQYPSRKVK